MSTRTTLAQTGDLPASLSLVEAAALLGIGRTHAYALQAAGQFPVPVLRLGRVLRVPTVPLLQLLGLPATGPSAVPDRLAPPPANGRDHAHEEPLPRGGEPS